MGRLITYRVEGLPAWASFDTSTTTFTGTPGFRDSGAYALRFYASDGELENSEDVLVTVGDLATIIWEDFADGDASGDPEWVVLRGGWTVASGAYTSKVLTNGISRVEVLDPIFLPLTVGMIEARMVLTSRYVNKPNGSILLALQDAAHYRYVRNEVGRILIGQVGAFGGVESGIKKKALAPIALGRPRRMRVKLFANGSVEVWNGVKKLGAYRFPSAIPGGVGLATSKAKTIFDDFRVWDDSVLLQQLAGPSNPGTLWMDVK